MQNQEIRQKPVQVDILLHKALKEYSAKSEKTMGDLIYDALMKDAKFRKIIEGVTI